MLSLALSTASAGHGGFLRAGSVKETTRLRYLAAHRCFAAHCREHMFQPQRPSDPTGAVAASAAQPSAPASGLHTIRC